jgi:hypothetical protein
VDQAIEIGMRVRRLRTIPQMPMAIDNAISADAA